MTALRVAGLVLALGVLQGTLSRVWVPLGYIDWLMIAVVYQAVQRPFRVSVAIGAFAGIIQDSLSGGLVGLHGFSKTAVAAVLASVGHVVIIRGPLAPAASAGIATIIEAGIVWWLLQFLGRSVSISLATITLTALATCFAAAAINILMTRFSWPWKRYR